jgi:hypothetical protein
MAQAPRDPSVLLATLALVDKHGGNVRAASREAGLPPATFQHRYEAAKQWSEQGHGKVASTESVSVTGNDCEITKTTTQRIKTLADLVRVCEIDTQEWDVERWVCNKWDSTAMRKNADGTTQPVLTEQFQIKAWLKRRVDLVAAKLEIASLLKDAAVKMPKRVTVVRSLKSPSNILFEPQIPDLHAGKLAWGDETGWEHYDLNTAVKLFDAALDVLIARSRSFGADRVLLPLGNDLLHSDTKAGTTTGGTPLDNDSRFHKVFAAVRRMSVRAIDRCREEIGPVKVILVPGNHDTLANWHLGDSLECWYRNDKGVEIDNSPRLRKYHQHGKVMLLHTHGNRGKLEAYPQIMAAEEPKMWGETVHREAHTGDKHHQRVLELKGCTVRISRALCPPDAWHSEMHFIGSARGAESFNWHPEEGLIGASFTTVSRDPAA